MWRNWFSNVRDYPLHVLTVSTDENVGLRNLLASLKTLQYENVHVIGQGEKWGGWPWRTEQYIKKIEQLKRDVGHDRFLVCLVDANDVFFIQGPQTLKEGFRNANCDVLVSGENTPMLLTGEQKAFFKSIGKSEFAYPCHGSIMGKASKLLEILKANRHSQDDQIGIAELRTKGIVQYNVDYDCAVTANVTPLSDSAFEIQEGKKLVAKHSGATPSICHFPPSMLTVCYNRMLNDLHPTLPKRSSYEGVKHSFLFKQIAKNVAIGTGILTTAIGMYWFLL